MTNITSDTAQLQVHKSDLLCVAIRGDHSTQHRQAMTAQMVSMHHFTNMVRIKQHFQQVKGETQGVDSIEINFGTAIITVEMIMLWMIVQQYFNSDRTPFSKVALALCALMIINVFDCATKLQQCPCTLLQGCTDTAYREKQCYYTKTPFTTMKTHPSPRLHSHCLH